MNSISTIEMSREDWLNQRRKGIGGSDVAGILGLSKWATPLSVYLDKIGEGKEQEDNRAMLWGRILEDPIAKQFQDESGIKVQKKNAMLQHREHDFLFANIDRKVVGENAGLEVKTSNAFKVSEWDDIIPNEYMLQCQHYMAVTGYEVWYLAVLIGGQDFRWYTIPRDNGLIENTLLPECIKFWREHVERRVPPAPSHSPIDRSILGELYSNPVENEPVELEDDFVQLAARQKELKEQEKVIKDELLGINNSITSRMGENIYARAGMFKFAWTPTSRTGFNTTKFKQEHPSLYEQYLKRSSSRTLRITAVKEN